MATATTAEDAAAASSNTSSNPTLAVGDECKGLWKTGRKWFTCTVLRVNEDGSYFLRYSDGDEWEAVPPERMKFMDGSPLPSRTGWSPDHPQHGVLW